MEADGPAGIELSGRLPRFFTESDIADQATIGRHPTVSAKQSPNGYQPAIRRLRTDPCVRPPSRRRSEPAAPGAVRRCRPVSAPPRADRNATRPHARHPRGDPLAHQPCDRRVAADLFESDLPAQCGGKDIHPRTRGQRRRPLRIPGQRLNRMPSSEQLGHHMPSRISRCAGCQYFHSEAPFRRRH